jgi:hypothetical protein
MILKNILGKLIKAAKNLPGLPANTADKQAAQKITDTDVRQDMRQKEKDIYGEERIIQQKLYEKWAIKTSWHLKNQAIPLLISVDPERYTNSDFDEDTEKKHEDLWKHAQHCVEQDLLFVLNRESPVDDWEATPVDIYKWAAISRVDIPEQLSTLMEFVMMTLLPTTTDTPDSKYQTDISYNSDKENILGAALAMLATYPEQCMNKKGRVRAENIISLINENQTKLFGKKIPGLSPTASVDLIKKWIDICS